MSIWIVSPSTLIYRKCPGRNRLDFIFFVSFNEEDDDYTCKRWVHIVNKEPKIRLWHLKICVFGFVVVSWRERYRWSKLSFDFIHCTNEHDRQIICMQTYDMNIFASSTDHKLLTSTDKIVHLKHYKRWLVRFALIKISIKIEKSCFVFFWLNFDSIESTILRPPEVDARHVIEFQIERPIELSQSLQYSLFNNRMISPFAFAQAMWRWTCFWFQ